MMKIETKICVVRKFIEKDIEEFMLYRNNEDWMQYQGFAIEKRSKKTYATPKIK